MNTPTMDCGFSGMAVVNNRRCQNETENSHRFAYDGSAGLLMTYELIG